VVLPDGRFLGLITNQTQEHALTVAGQWRIFTAFPSIPLQIDARERAAGRFLPRLRAYNSGQQRFPPESPL
jgi:hypothetical protein